VLWWFHLKGGVTPPTPPLAVIVRGGGGLKKKKRKPYTVKETAKLLLAMEPGTPEYERAQRKLKAQVADQGSLNDEELIVMLIFLDLL
jgi:hypothetical protein